MKFDPWKVEEIESYGKLFKEFGIAPMDEFKEKFGDNSYIKRGIIFGHRDFGKIANAILNKKPYIMMTGLMPSGRFHFGHKMVADQIIWHQQKGGGVYIAAADLESYLMRDIPLDIARKIAVEEYLTNYLALGLSEKNLHFWFQTDYKTPYYRLRDMAAKEVTFNELRAIYGDLSPNKIFSALTQVADILHPQLPEFEDAALPTVVPVGADQDPHLRLTRDIAVRLEGNFRLEVPSATFHRLLEGLQGGKMSSSDPKSHIALSEDPKEARRKVMSALTGGRETAEEQRKLGGRPDECAVYKLYYYHLVEDDKEVQRIYNDCKTGKILCGEDKKRCADLMEKFLVEHQKRMGKARTKAERIVGK
ncbi:MAG: tryptophan--tRNA ligase [Candidatus Altiarchaeota archaeon]|nr:tryptophan--tRNA ligase [Candidatus Altiarchaeota archaeon]